MQPAESSKAAVTTATRADTARRGTIAVSIVEDEAGLRQTLARFINGAPGFQCLSMHASGEEALRKLPAEKPDVVLMDIQLPHMNGVECARQLKALVPQTHIVMLTVYENPELIFQALAAGATGYLLKQTPPAQLLAAIQDVVAGGSPMSSQIARKVVLSFLTPPVAIGEECELSPREREVLDLLARGFANKEIADALNISFETVRTYIRRSYEKLHVRTRAEAVAKHLGHGR